MYLMILIAVLLQLRIIYQYKQFVSSAFGESSGLFQTIPKYIKADKYQRKAARKLFAYFLMVVVFEMTIILIFMIFIHFLYYYVLT